MKPTEMIVPTNVTTMQTYFIILYLQNDVPLMFIGPTGTGKSTIVLNLLLNLPKEKYLPNIINFSARSSSNITQEMIMTKLDRRRKGVYGPAMGKKYVIFIGKYGCGLDRRMKGVYGPEGPGP
uniref:Dynein heavy chain 3, axonemal n=1 Tax=Cacopsylla melanoneura TaxID=428564 RepID=A0A8D8PQB4_9HEMI